MHGGGNIVISLAVMENYNPLSLEVFNIQLLSLLNNNCYCVFQRLIAKSLSQSQVMVICIALNQ